MSKINIAIYGSTDKRPIVFGLFKLLQNLGSVLFVTRERHYSRLIDKEELGYFQNVLICSTDVSPDCVFDYMKVNPKSFDFILFDIDTCIPKDIDLTITCTSYQDELLTDDLLYELPEPIVHMKMMFDSKREKDSYNVRPSGALYKYIEIVESLKILPPFTFRDISGLLEQEIGPRVSLDPKTVRKTLEKEWSD